MGFPWVWEQVSLCSPCRRWDFPSLSGSGMGFSSAFQVRDKILQFGDEIFSSPGWEWDFPPLLGLGMGFPSALGAGIPSAPRSLTRFLSALRFVNETSLRSLVRERGFPSSLRFGNGISLGSVGWERGFPRLPASLTRFPSALRFGNGIPCSFPVREWDLCWEWGFLRLPTLLTGFPSALWFLNEVACVSGSVNEVACVSGSVNGIPCVSGSVKAVSRLPRCWTGAGPRGGSWR